MRTKKAFYGTVTSLLLQLVTAITGLVLPRLIIGTFGSDVNGVVSSITQLLSYIHILEAGIGSGGVVSVALYKPLAEKDNLGISSVLKASNIFFRKIALLFIPYALLIGVIFPLITDSEFDWFFTFSMVIILAIGTLMEYLLGVSNSILLRSDQRSYIINIINIFIYIANTAIAVALIFLGAGIHVVKLASVAVFAMRPVIIRLYVNKAYNITRDCRPNKNTFNQRTDAFIHHLANFVHNNADITIITLFMTFADVSVYSVHNMIIVAAIRKITVAFFSPAAAGFANMMAKNEHKLMYERFKLYEYMASMMTALMFTVTGLTISPFISVYTASITDANYVQPIFATLFVLAEAVYCIRIPYINLVSSAGHFKQTRNASVIEAVINVALSLVLVFFFGLPGVMIGTLVGMIYRTISLALYLSKNIIKYPFKFFARRQLISIATSILIIAIVKIIPFTPVTGFADWLLQAAAVGAIALSVTLIISLLFDRKRVFELLTMIKGVFKRA